MPNDLVSPPTLADLMATAYDEGVAWATTNGKTAGDQTKPGYRPYYPGASARRDAPQTSQERAALDTAWMAGVYGEPAPAVPEGLQPTA
ncbi:MAG: hypothetical protein EPO08_03535 [Rhodospirillaceae bacterium]|nr:MAG: hypothetical protein EPO08_03535 [Rhodospirillaceae bacterium]